MQRYNCALCPNAYTERYLFVGHMLARHGFHLNVNNEPIPAEECDCAGTK